MLIKWVYNISQIDKERKGLEMTGTGSQKTKYDLLIVGSGLYGATFAWLARRRGMSCLVVERRPHTGGNVHCESVEGINVHSYGAHIFHTSSKRVWDFAGQFVHFNRYTNCPVANYRGRLFNLPFNMNTFYEMWNTATPSEAMMKIEAQKSCRAESRPRNLEEQAVALIGSDLYKILVKEYTEKQWGRPCTDLPPSIIRRLPVRFTFDNNYFNDPYQGIPIGGYNKLTDALLDGTEVLTDTDYFAGREKWKKIAARTIFTGRIDEFFDFRFGPLEYRSLRFETEVLNVQNFQGNAVMNFTSKREPYTRIIEHKHFEPESPAYGKAKTVITKEYPAEWEEGAEAFYPVNDERNSGLYRKYQSLAERQESVIFGGRLAEYRYYDMDEVIGKALTDFEKYIR